MSPRRGGNLRASAKRQRLSLCGPHRVTKITINSGRDRDRANRRATDGDKEKRFAETYGDRDRRLDLADTHEDRERVDRGVANGGSERVGGADGSSDEGGGEGGETGRGNFGGSLAAGDENGGEIEWKPTEKIVRDRGKNGEEGGVGLVGEEGRDGWKFKRGILGLEESDDSGGEEVRGRNGVVSPRHRTDFSRSVSVPISASGNLSGHNADTSSDGATESSPTVGDNPPGHTNNNHSSCLPQRTDVQTHQKDALPSSVLNGARPPIARQSNASFYF